MNLPLPPPFRSGIPPTARYVRKHTIGWGVHVPLFRWKHEAAGAPERSLADLLTTHRALLLEADRQVVLVTLTWHGALHLLGAHTHCEVLARFPLMHGEALAAAFDLLALPDFRRVSHLFLCVDESEAASRARVFPPVEQLRAALESEDEDAPEVNELAEHVRACETLPAVQSRTA